MRRSKAKTAENGLGGQSDRCIERGALDENFRNQTPLLDIRTDALSWGAFQIHSSGGSTGEKEAVGRFETAGKYAKTG